jgi:hypothetical protein
MEWYLYGYHRANVKKTGFSPNDKPPELNFHFWWMPVKLRA